MMHLAGCAVFDDQGRVLLIHRNSSDLSWWEMPGGKVEDREEPSVAGKREIKEELGVEVEVLDPLGEYDFDFRGTPCTYHYFQAEIIDGQPKPQESKHDACEYVDIRTSSYEFSNGVKGLKTLLK